MAKSGKAAFLSDRELGLLFKAVGKNRYPSRDRLAIALGRWAGLRVSEVAGLQWRDVLSADQTEVSDHIELRAEVVKGSRKAGAAKAYRRARTVPMRSNVRTLIEELRERYPNRVQPHAPLIWSEEGTHFTANSLSRVFLRWCAKAGLVGVSFHSLRRTFITTLSRTCGQHGGSLEDVRELAGHSDIRTTAVYLCGERRSQVSMIEA